MAKIKVKGSALRQDVSGMVAVAQIISFGFDGAESETYESDTLDNTSAGIPYDETGRTEGGSFSAELFFDPVLAGHQNITDLLITPAGETWDMTFADAGSTVWPFSGAGLGFGITAALNDGLKASLTIKLDTIVDYPT